MRSNRAFETFGYSLLVMLGCLLNAELIPRAVAQAVSATASAPPKTWVDEETGHRIFRLSEERGATAMYFTDNISTPDGADMIYTKLEPNAHITPDDKYVIFTSNMLGTEYVFAVEIAKQPAPGATGTSAGK